MSLLAARSNDILAKINLGDVLYLTGETQLFAGKLPEARADMQGCFALYEEVVHVPLLVRARGMASGRRSDTVSLLDVAPTIRAIAGVPAKPSRR